VYIILQFAIIGPRDEICHGSERFSHWVGAVKVAVVACFFLSSFTHMIIAAFLGYGIQRDMDHPVAVYSASATVSLIAGISTLVTVLDGERHICKDVFGVETYQAQWAEWITTVPLLGYITIALEDKSKISWRDKGAIASTALMIAFGFAMNFKGAESSPSGSWSEHEWKAYGCVMFVISVLCMSAVIVIAWRAANETKVYKEAELVASVASARWQVERAAMKGWLSRLLVVFLPMFPAIYVLRWTKVISRYNKSAFIGLIPSLVSFPFTLLLWCYPCAASFHR
jgi:hypothetical protein